MLIKFDLITNAKDSLRHAVQLLAWDGSPPSSATFKQAILSVAHCAELLLKERLRLIHPAFVWQNIDKYPQLDARTVSLKTAISRLESIGNVRLDPADVGALKSCRQTRNAIEHYEFEIEAKEAKVILGTVLSFIFSFSSSELKQDLDQEFKSDDTWEMLFSELYEFAKAHGSRVAALQAARDAPLADCPQCGQTTLDLSSGSCGLCGHWSFDDDEGDLPR